MSKQLSESFIYELFKICLRKKNILEVVRDHMKFHYLPDEHHKEVWKYISDYHEQTSACPSLGLLSEAFKEKLECSQIVTEIRKAELPLEDSIVDAFQVYIRSKKFIEVFADLKDLFNQGQKEEVFQKMHEVSEEILAIKIRSVKDYTPVLSTLMERYDIRKSEVDDKEDKGRKATTGLPQIDYQCYGGVQKGTAFLVMGGSGTGKSKFLKHVGLKNALVGMKVLHIQAEGTRDEAMNAYDAGFIGMSSKDLKFDTIPTKKMEQIKGAVSELRNRGAEIYVKAFEQFDTATMRNVRDYLEKLTDEVGQIDVLIVDYLELLDPGDGKSYGSGDSGERRRRESLANKFVNVCMEFNVAGFTATQSNTPPPDMTEDSNFCLTRHNISEFKGLVKPFAYFMTLNQTKSEYESNSLRVYLDKLRHHKIKTRVIPVCIAFGKERFYDHHRTLKIFGSDINS